MRRLVLVLTLALGATAANAAVEPVTLTNGPDPAPLAGHIEVLRDVDPAWTLDEVRKPENAERFTAAAGKNFGFGFSQNANWLRFALHNPRPDVSDAVLELGWGLIDEFDLHVIHGDGRVETTLTGDRRVPSANLLTHHNFALPLRIAAGETATVYIGTRNAGGQIIDLDVWPSVAFHTQSVRDNFVWGGYFLATLVMGLYNLLIYLWLRDRGYLYYGLVLLVVVPYTMALTGYGRQIGAAYSDAASILFSNAFPYFSLVITLFNLLFVCNLLQTAQHLPRLDRWLRVWAFVLFAACLAAPFLSYPVALRLSFVTFGINIVGGCIIAGVLAFRRVRAAYFFLAAFALLGLGQVLASAAAFMGAAATRPLVYITVATAVISYIVFSLALADRFNIERRERERFARLKNFFAPQVAEAILDEGGASLLAPKRREVTVVFTDLRGFTALAAQSEPEDVIRVLREYHEAVVETSAKHGGNVEHIAGDGVMVYFNAPIEVSEPEARAVRMGFELRTQFETLCQNWKKRGHELGVGIGMACGYATVGSVGAKGRMDYSCIGTVTNLAARLCGLAKHGQILVPQLFVNRVESRLKTEPLGEQELKGMPKPVAVFNLVAPVG